MNTFKTVSIIVVICAMMAASCSGQYISWGSKGSQIGSVSGLSGMMGGQSASFTNKNQQFASNIPAFTVEQQMPAASPLIRPASSSSVSATTQQICSCVNINSAASAQPSTAVASSTSEFTTTAAFAAPQQQAFSAPQEQAAPQQQISFVAPVAAQQQQTYATPVQSHRRY
ncbi:hypothetical protein GHT06_016227 [Daphnia sinensis]|uniref:Uncharacterized protein n=1 Tax=Daphnia sinensis TaxID=1820382 RepID=A0AAD5L652_9CRUS|nr:hypothetical protein GHT06_016206 [Daphnia sinensis]KAI9556439.1 hypothetical protein GHT06_016227 [Daphnia sinensis]